MVIERGHAIGVLRAIRYQRRTVVLGLLTESAAAITIGAVVGGLVGIATGFLFHRQSESPARFGVDLASLGGVPALIYTAVLLSLARPRKPFGTRTRVNPSGHIVCHRIREGRRTGRRRRPVPLG